MVREAGVAGRRSSCFDCRRRNVRREVAWAFHLYAVIENSYVNISLVAIVSMKDRVCDCFLDYALGIGVLGREPTGHLEAHGNLFPDIRCGALYQIIDWRTYVLWRLA